MNAKKQENKKAKTVAAKAFFPPHVLVVFFWSGGTALSMT